MAIEKRVYDSELANRKKGTSQREVLSSSLGMSKKKAGKLVKETDKKYGKPKERMAKENKYNQKKFDLAKTKVYQSGMQGNNPINFASKKTKRGIIKSID